MGDYFKKIVCVFILLILVKVVLSFFIPAPTQFIDEYLYQRMGQSFLHSGEFLLDELPSTMYPPLYPIIISPAFLFINMKLVFFFIKFINIIISSTIIFSGFLLAKEFMSKKKAFKVSILISFIPPLFGFFPFVMSENLFYPLFLFTIYFMYKSFVEKEIYWSILAGLFIGLCALTKVIGLLLVIIYGLILFIKFLKEKDFVLFLKKGLLSGLFFFIAYGWWMLRNYLIFGNVFGLYGKNLCAVGDKVSSFSFIAPVLKSIIYNSSYLIIACLLIFFIYALLSYRKDNYKWFYILGLITIIIYILFVSLYNYKLDNSSRLIGRYFAQLIPIVLVMGFVGLRKKINLRHWIPVFIFLFIISGFRFITDRLIPVNNMSLSYLGVLDFVFNFMHSNYLLVVFLGLLPFTLVLLKRLKLKHLFVLGLIFLILVNLLSFGINFYNSNYRWHDQDPVQVGLWFNDYLLENEENIDDLIVVFDKRDDGRIRREYVNESKYNTYTQSLERPYNEVTGFWINSKVRRFCDISDFENIVCFKSTEYEKFKESYEVEDVDYIFSSYELDLELIKEGEKIYIYRP